VRSLKGWIDYVGKDHLHHRLERALCSRRASVTVIFTLTICLGLAAMVLRRADTAEAIMLLTQAVLFVMIITILEHRDRQDFKHDRWQRSEAEPGSGHGLSPQEPPAGTRMTDPARRKPTTLQDPR
ncbi:MAG: hypothetical protein ACREI3_12110, partial [Nitrospirales bacterium]